MQFASDPLMKLYWLKCFIAQRKAHIKWTSKKTSDIEVLHLLPVALCSMTAVQLNLHSFCHDHICREPLQIHNSRYYRSFCETFGSSRRGPMQSVFFLSTFGSGQWRYKFEIVSCTTMSWKCAEIAEMGPGSLVGISEWEEAFHSMPCIAFMRPVYNHFVSVDA